jgi:tRNA G18 (ribose-2'-O)-methylase SpoU
MSKLKIKTLPDMSLSSSAHLAAKEDIEGNYRAWQQNVTNDLKGKSDEEIRLHLKATAHPFAVAFEHWIGDFNMGTGIRNANAFNAKEVFYVGERKWDKRSAVGVYNYTDVQWIPTVEDFKKLKERYVIVGIDNVPGSVSIRNYHWPRNTLMVFGEEGPGLTPEMLALCKDVVEIPMFGSVRSLNCGTASGIVMYDYVEKLDKRIRDME